jgi:protein-disulfide isomerase
MSGRLLMGVLASTLGLAGQQPLVEGRADSRVRVIVYEDLQCPDCAAFRRMMDEKLLPRYGSKVAFIHKDFPLAKHAWARKAAIAARFFAASKPELGVRYRRQIMAGIPETTEANFDLKLAEFARQQGIGAEKALAALNDARYAEWVEKDFQEGVARGVAKTPAVFVNGKPFIEHFSFEEISKAIDEALAESN